VIIETSSGVVVDWKRDLARAAIELTDTSLSYERAAVLAIPGAAETRWLVGTALIIGPRIEGKTLGVTTCLPPHRSTSASSPDLFGNQAATPSLNPLHLHSE
jgi:hypothetical protein